MNANDYQEQAARTLINGDEVHLTQREQELIEQALTAYIAAGNVVDALKKQIFHRHGVDHAMLTRLVADVKQQALRTAAFLDDLRHFPNAHQHSPLTPQQRMALWVVAGLAGESAEVAGLVVAGQPGLTEEIGDLQWYAAAICTQAGTTLGGTMQANLDKLRRRYPDGWNEADSLARVDKE